MQALTEDVAADGAYVYMLNPVDIASRMSDSRTRPSAADLTRCFSYRKPSIEMLATHSRDALQLAPTPHDKYIADEIKLPCLLSSHQNIHITGQYFNAVALDPQQSPFPQTIVFDEIPANSECPTVDTARDQVLTAVQKDAPDLIVKVQDAKRYAHRVRIADAQSQQTFFAVTVSIAGALDRQMHFLLHCGQTDTELAAMTIIHNGQFCNGIPAMRFLRPEMAASTRQEFSAVASVQLTGSMAGAKREVAV